MYLVNNVIYGWGTWKIRPGERDEGLSMLPGGALLELHVTNNWYEAVAGLPEYAIVGMNNFDSTKIDFEGNVFPTEEIDDVDTSASPSPPATSTETEMRML